MMEFYAAWWNYRDLMDFTEQLIRDAAMKAVGTLDCTYAGKPVDLAAPFERLSIPRGHREIHRCGRERDQPRLADQRLAQAGHERGQRQAVHAQPGEPAGAVL